MSNNKKIILAAEVIIILCFVIFYGMKTGWWKKSGAPASEISLVQPTSLPAFTRQELAENIIIPEPDSKPQNQNIAVPKSSVPAAPGLTERQLRTFDISAQNGQYVPSEIIVGEGDSVVINFKAEDGAYGIVFPDYGLKQTAKKGETKIVAFQAVSNGQFKFYCESLCPKGEMEGTLIVAPR